MWTKRLLIAALCLLGATSAALPYSRGQPANTPIQSVRFGNVPFGISPFPYNSQYPTKYVNGDTWYSTWADDGNIYVTSNDVFGWNCNSSSPCPSSNIQISKLTTPVDGTTTGTLVNGMASWGFQGQGGGDGATWKSAALYSVNGVLYLSIYRQFTGAAYCAGGLSYQAQIIKSSDHGVTWTPTPPSTAAPYASSMFSDPHQFMAPVQYTNQNYVGNTVDNSGTYVYGLFVQLGGNTVILGRVAIANIGNLSAGDWTWYTGGDGMVNSNWVSGQGNAVPVPGLPGTVSVQYIPALGRYLSVGGGAIAAGCAVEISGAGAMSAYEAPHPWGPWTQVGNILTTEDNPYNFYFTAPVMNTVVGNKVTYLYSADFKTFGNTNGQGPPLGTAYYTMWIADVVVNADWPPTPVPGSCAQSIQFFTRVRGGLDPNHRTAYDNMICGMVADGTWQLLDILYIFATNNQNASLTNLVKTGTATLVGTTFQADRGYTGTDTQFTATDYIQIPYVLDQIGGNNFTANNSHISAWVLTNNAATLGGDIMGIGFSQAVELAITYNDGKLYAAMNDTNSSQAATGGLATPPSRIGHWFLNRTGASLDQLWLNAGVYATLNATNTGSIVNTCGTQESFGNFTVLARYICTANPPNQRGTPNQVAMVSAGASMTPAQIAAFYSRLRTYLTAVGVP